jgi:hypothetical protein
MGGASSLKLDRAVSRCLGLARRKGPMEDSYKPWIFTTSRERIIALEVNVTKTEGMKVMGYCLSLFLSSLTNTSCIAEGG